MIKTPQQAAPLGRNYRVSSESAFPLRDLNGKTWAERRKEKEQGK
jgi:hypothetical protein